MPINGPIKGCKGKVHARMQKQALEGVKAGAPESARVVHIRGQILHMQMCKDKVHVTMSMNNPPNGARE